MRQYKISITRDFSIHDLSNLAQKISGEDLSITYHDSDAFIKLNGCASVEVILDINHPQVILLQHGVLKSYLIGLLLFCLKELGQRVEYKIPYWANKKYKNIWKYEVWFF